MVEFGMGETMVELECAHCSATFQRRRADVLKAQSRGRKSVFCSRECVAYGKRKALIKATCQQCGSDFERVSHGPKKEHGLFCSTACVARYQSAKRRGTGKRLCPDCGGHKHETSPTCRRCKSVRLNTRSLSELRAASKTTMAFSAWVRGLARHAYQGQRVCASCGYDLFVQICHVRPVADFPPDATLAEVNDPANLVALDVRCHWELDHGHLRYVDGTFVRC